MSRAHRAFAASARFCAPLAVAAALVACAGDAPAPAPLPRVHAAPLEGDVDDPVRLTVPASSSAAIAPNTSRHYRLTVPASHQGLRVAVGCTGQVDLILRHGAPTGSALQAKNDATFHTVFVTAAATTADDLWYVEVHADADVDCTLTADDAYARPLTWDDGETQAGDDAVAAPDNLGGDYLFQLPSQTSAWGAWRHVLTVTSGEADLYVQKNAYPTDSTTWRSTNPGSDAVVLGASDFAANQTWYLRVHASPGAAWSLVSGDLYVPDLGPLGPDDAAPVSLPVGPEGSAWFRTTIPADTLAWRLASAGATLHVTKGAAPVPSRGRYEVREADASLLVPTYLTSGQYVVAVERAGVSSVTVDSRRQRIRVASAEPGAVGDDFAFTATLADDGFPWVTWRVDVPVDQIAWQVAVTPLSGTADVYVRKGDVPNATRNDGLSEAPGALVDTVTQVPPNLTNGTWYVSVRAAGPGWSCRLTSGNPEITDVAFVNDPVPVGNGAAHEAQVGWRYFRVPDIASQVGTLGWILDLEGAPAGTEIALRRNAVPGRWVYRANGATSTSQSSRVDVTATSGFLERPNHEADIWYIGIYHPTAALGPFALRTRTFQPTTLAMNGGAVTVSDQVSGRWRYYKVIVPPGGLGWDLALDPVTSGKPRMVIRRDILPASYGDIPSTGINEGTQWASTWQWAVGNDLTNRPYAPYVQGQSADNRQGRHMWLGMGSFLSEGTYYIGVTDLYTTPAGTPLGYTLTSRGVGVGDAPTGGPWAIQVADLAWDGGSATVTDAAPRDVRFWRVTVPDDVESWFLSLEPSVGEAMMAIRRELLGNSDAVSSTSDSSSTSGARRQKTGYELFYKYPTSSQATLTPGTYYVAVGAEGQAPHSSSYIGTGPTTYTLTSHGEAELRGGADTLLPADTPLAWHGETLRYGEQRAYRFTVPAGVLSMEIRLTTASGYPRYTVAHPTTANGPFPNPSESYGASEGGGSSVTGGDGIVTLVEPSGVYTILVVARSGADGEVGAVYDLDVVARGEGVIPFNGGVASVTDHESQTWRYFRVDVPAGALGWDLRIRNVQSGNPRLVVKRDDSPTSVSSTTYFPYYFDEWRTGYQWAAGTDITGRTYAPRVDGQPNVNESGHTVTMGMGSPLEPGSYVVGVTDPGGQTGAPMAYEIESRGIGVGDDADGQPWRIQVGELAFDGGVATVDALPAREIAYYRVDVPPGAATWGLELDPTTPGGEGLLAVRKDNPPNSYANASRSDETGNPSGTRRQRAGGELFYKYPDSGDAALDGGAYYVAVASEGVAPYSTGYVGAGAVSFELRSVGVLPVVQADHELGLDAPVAFLGESLPAGAQRTYRFTVPEGVTLMEVRLENTTGAPSAAVSLMPVPFPNPRDSGYVAAEGGGATVATGTDLMNVADPLGTYTVIVAANPSGTSGDVGATYDLTITARGERPLAFNGGVAAVTAQEPGTWRYFRVTVPDDGQLGWDLAIENVQSGRPQLVARRDELPTSVSSTSNLVNGSTWRTGYQLAASTDITNRAYPPRQPSNNVYEGGRRFTVGMNAPLEPGTYVVGVIDQSSNAEPASYELVSRTVGVGTDADGEPWTWQVADLAFDGGAVSLVGLEPREVRYFRVQVPPGARSWEVDLDPALGEAMLAVNVDAIPSSFASGVSVLPGGNRQGARRQKAGPERYYRYPRSAERAIDGGTFYLAVAAEGQDPYNASYIGTGPTDVTLTSVGEAPEVGAGSVVTAATPVRYAAQTLAYGEERIYHVRVPDELPSFEVRLEGVAGRPEYAVGLYDFFADSVPSISTTYRASDGGTSTIATGTLSSEVVGRHGDVTIVVGADDLSGVPADATFDLVVQGGGVGALAFDGGQVSAAIVDRATRTYRVDIPQDCDAVPAAGWVLGLEVRSGTAQLRVRKDRLPGEPAGGTTLTTSARETVLAPPFFAPGIWYVTVAATGLTDFTLTSRPVAAERVWAMPVAGEAPAAPGLAAPVFADTGVDPDGAPHVNPSTGGPGVDLGQDRYHYYRVTVPPGNGGFWRTQLEAISGNPNLYIRRDAAPTLNHGSSGTGGSLYDWYDTQTGSSYGHWAVANSRTDGAALPPGEYWIAVTAVGSNVRYRLTVSGARVDELAQAGGAIAGHALAAGDMRFYHVRTADTATDAGASAPLEWRLNLIQQQGDVIVFFRERAVPGSAGAIASLTSPQSAIRDWSDDRSLSGYGSGLPLTIDAQGTTTLPLGLYEPGADYFLGVFAKTDAVYDLGSSVGATALALDDVLDFAAGHVSGTLAAGERRVYRVDVPEDAARIRVNGPVTSGLVARLQLDTLPPASGADYTSSGATVAVDKPTYAPSGYVYNHPWRPGRSYYLTLDNPGTGDRTYDLTLDGRTQGDDSDADGLPDWWEYNYFGSLSSSATGDNDNDGLDNASELAAATDPSDWDSDDDLLADGLEVDLGADPLAGDSDDDGVCDGEDSAPTDPNESGRVIRLTLGEYEGREYGYGFGSNEHVTSLVAVFTKQGSDKGQFIHVRGWDIDTADEVTVTLNGQPLGALPAGADGADARAVMFYVETAKLVSGRDNRLTLTKKGVASGGDGTWGVRDLGLFGFGESFGFDSTAAYDTLHPDGFVIHWPKIGEALLELRAFDADSPGELAVTLNGGALFELPAGPSGGDLAWTDYLQLPLLVSDSVTGDNVVDVRPGAGSDGDWQLRLVACRPLLSQFGTATTTEENHDDAGVSFLLPRAGVLRELKVDTRTEAGGAVRETGSRTLDETVVNGTSYGPERIFCSDGDAVDWARLDYLQNPDSASHQLYARVRYYGAEVDTDNDTHFDCHDAFPRAADEWEDADGDRLGDAWENHWFGGLGVADATTDVDGDGKPDLQEFLDRDDPVCADLDGDEIVGRSVWCATGTDCDDHDPEVGGSADDADCDGITTDLDCDDGDPAVGASENDADCDLVPTDLDCDDTDPTVTTSVAEDADCDGVPTAADCDDQDPAAVAIADDNDCDGVLRGVDCDDGDAGVVSTNVGDADCDGVLTGVDCDDGDAGVTATNVGDADCDGVPSAIDCDDGSAAVTTTNVNDADCDGVAAGVDCDDGSAAVTTTNVNDGDCDGVPTALDCDDANASDVRQNTGDLDCDGVPSALDCDDQSASNRATRVNDGDCDGVATPIDCDDTDPAEHRSNLHDADCDDVPSDLDCDDHDAADTRTREGDADCDGIATDDDCDDADPAVATTRANDKDCDGVPTADDCDDDDAAIATSTASDHDCDGLVATLDCDDDDAGDVRSNANDKDCDGVPSALDCDDHDAATTTTTAEDRDCDGVLGAVDCDDTDAEETGTCGSCVDADADGLYAPGDDCARGDDCDDADPDGTWLAIDADCDGVPTDEDCDDADVDLGAVNEDADCDGLPTEVDCDDADASNTSVCGERCVDKDGDGHDAASPYCAAGIDCDDHDPESTTTAEDADCDGVVTADDCDDADPRYGARALDGDCDGVPDARDVCPDRADPDQLDGDGDGYGDLCDRCPAVADDQSGDACKDSDGDGVPDADDNCPSAANPAQLDLDHDGRGDVCDEVVTFDQSTSGGCAGGGAGAGVGLGLVLAALALGLGLLLARRARTRRRRAGHAG